MTAGERRAGALLAVILAAAAAVRLVGLGAGLWFDEIWLLVDFGRRPLAEVLTTYGSDNNHPLYTLLARAALLSFGESPVALRLPAYLFGVAGVWALWRLAGRVTTRSEARLATTLLALSAHHVWFSQNARGYTALLFFTLVATEALLRVLDGDRRRRTVIVYALSVALATYTHTTAVFVAAAHLAVIAASWRRHREPCRRAAAGLLLATLVSLALHAAILREMIAFLLPSDAGPRVEAAWTSPWWTIRAAAESLGLGLTAGLAALAAAAAVLVAGAVSFARQDGRLAVLFLLPGVLGAIVMIGLGRNLWPRFFFFLSGFLLLIGVRSFFLLAGVLGRIGPLARNPSNAARLKGVAAACAVLASIGLLVPRAGMPKQDYGGAQAWIAAHREPGDAILTCGLTVFPYERYYDAGYRAIATARELDAALAESRRVLVLHTLPAYLASRHPDLARALAERGEEVARFPGTVGGGDILVLHVRGPD